MLLLECVVPTKITRKIVGSVLNDIEKRVFTEMSRRIFICGKVSIKRG